MIAADRFYGCLGTVLFVARCEKRLRQSDVARLSGVTLWTIDQLERGCGTQDVRKLCAVAETLGVNPGDLLRRAAATSA